MYYICIPNYHSFLDGGFFMKRSFRLFLFLLGAALTGAGCFTSGATVTTTDDCTGATKSSFDTGVIKPSNMSWSTKTPLAAGDCTTIYQFYFRWSDSTKRWHLPEIPTVTVVFTPSGPPGFDPTPEHVEATIPGYPGTDWLEMTFAPTPTSIPGNTTAFTINASLQAGTVDSVDVVTNIVYRLSTQ